MISTTLSDTDLDQNIHADTHQFFSLHGSSIVTIIDLPGSIFSLTTDKKVRLLIRDATGRYCWDMQAFYHGLDEIRNTHDCNTSVTTDIPYRTVEQPPYIIDLN